MTKRKYTNLKVLLPEIREMLVQGKSHREIEGRPRTRPLAKVEEYEREIARLQMENKLLRDFLQSVERK